MTSLEQARTRYRLLREHVKPVMHEHHDYQFPARAAIKLVEELYMTVTTQPLHGIVT